MYMAQNQNMAGKVVSYINTNYPFEKEREYSVKLLYKFFCNNLYLGQWELARACLKQLHEEKQFLTINITDVLFDIAEYPFQRSCNSGRVGSPHHLAWLCLHEYGKLTCNENQEKKSDPSILRKDVEFRLLLIEAFDDASETVVKELYLYHLVVVKTYVDQTQGHVQPTVLSSDVLKFLQQKLLEKPILGHSLITALVAKSDHSQFKKNNEVLRNLYLKSINNILDRNSKENESDNSSIDTVYQLLSLYDPEPYENYLPLRELFSRLLELSASDRSAVDKNSVLSLLVGRSNSYLVEEFCNLDYEMETKSVPLSGGQHGDNLTDDQRCLQHLTRETDRTRKLHLLFLMCLKKQQHLLKNVVETAINLIKSGMFADLKVLLEPPEFQPLKSLLLLHGWSFCISVTQAKTLLDILWDKKAPCKHSALEAGCSKLAYQIDLIQWCLDRTKPLISLEEGKPTVNHQQRAADMFVGLENHSVLYVLHKSTHLASINQQEVLDLLQKSPLHESDVGNGKKLKSVRFSCDGDESTEPNTINDIQIERRRDTSIYSGFCAIKNVMDIIYFCAEYQDTHLMKPIRVTNFISTKHFEDCDNVKGETESLPAENMSDKKERNFKEVYKENVTEKLESTKLLLSKLQPLAYRVEILENIFSLLFLTHEDIQESSLMIDSDSGEVDESESSCKDVVTNGEMRKSIISEESMTPTSPLDEIKFDNHGQNTFRDNHSENISYDEPYIDSHRSTSRKMSRSSAILGHLTNQKGENSPRLKPLVIKDFELSHRGSGNASTLSLDSVSSCLLFGFLSNEYLVRDILAMLKECLVDLNAARFKVLGKKNENIESKLKLNKKDVSNLIDVKLEEPLSHLVQSSVSSDSLQNRMAQLSQYIHEAQWRFNLVSHEQIPKNPGEVLLEPILVPGDFWDEEIDLSNLSIEFSSKHARKRRHTTVSTNGSKSSLSFDSPNETHSTDTTLDGEVIKKRRSRSRSRQRSRSRTYQKQPTGIIPLMLSSPESLLNMCIRRGHLTHVAQVIKMLKLEDRYQSVEVQFLQEFSKSVKKLQGLNIGIHGKVTKATKPGRMSMKAIASVAAAGVATVSVTTIADELLSLPKLPRVPRPRACVKLPLKLKQHFEQENCQALILFDLLCTACRSWEMCNNMVDALKSRLPEISDSQLMDSYEQEVKRQDSGGEDVKIARIDQKMKNIVDVLKQFEDILQLGAENDNTSSPSRGDVLLALYKHSIQTFLQTATLPLNTNECGKYADFILNMKIALDKVDHTFRTFGKMPLEGFMHKSAKISPKSKSSPRNSPKPETLTDRPVIHTAVKQLIQVVEKGVPVGGLYQLYLKKISELSKNRDYLLNLYEHLKGLAFIVAECEAKSKETMVIPRNYFRMLDEGPITILGRLMFSKKIPPARLEKVAKKLSLDLTQIIVHSCCPEIPSKHQQETAVYAKDAETRSKKLCMNCVGNNTVENFSLQPNDTLCGILTKLLKLMKDTAGKSNTKGIFDLNSAELIVKDEEYKDLIKSTDKLQLVDLRGMKTKEEKVCFFGNLQNLMCLHMNLYLYEHSGFFESEDTTQRRHISGQTVKPFFEMPVTEQISYMNLFSYKIGQMGIISFFELKYIINRNGLVPPSEYDGILKHGLYEIDKSDPWYEFIPQPDPRMLFIFTSCSQSSPPVQILVPEMVNTQLHTAMKEYLNHSITVDHDRNTITVPQLLMWYKEDFSTDQDGHYTAENEGIINFIAEQTTDEIQSSVTELIQLDRIHGYSENIDRRGRKELPFNIGIDTFLDEFLVAFDHSVLRKTFQKVRGHRRIISLPKNLEKSSELGRSVSRSNSKTPAYQLTPVTLQYVQAECPLVATLVSLVCSDELDDIEEHLTEDYFSDNLRERTASEMSLVDIRSYRYQKLTDDYQTLKRHLLSYVIPIAGAEDPEILKRGDPLLKLITSNMSEKVKACMLNLHDSVQFQTVVVGMLGVLLADRKWSEIITVMDSFPSLVLQERADFVALHDFTLCCLIYEKLCDNDLSDSHVHVIINCAKRFYSVEKKIRVLMKIYKRLPIDHNIELFEMCFYQCRRDCNLRDTVSNKLKELKMFYRITECAKNLQFKLSLQASDYISSEEKGEFHEALDKFIDWRKILSPSVTSLEEVLSVLMRAGDFETAKLWCKYHNQLQDKYIEVVEHHLVSLLDHQPPKATKAFLILDSVKERGVDTCLTLCHKLLEKMSNHEHVLFIISYMLNELSSELEDEQIDELRLTHMGAKVLLCLPNSLRGEYCQLVSSPFLLLEQLLMNMNIELAGKAFGCIKNDLKKLKDPAKQFTQEEFNSLVGTYARKAVEFIVVQSILLEKERSQSQCSTASSDKLEATPDKSPPKRASLYTDTLKSQRRSVDITASTRLISSVPSSSPRRQGLTLPQRSGILTNQKFVMPAEPPSKDKWVPDNHTDTCMACRVERFSMFNRRHHCRRCGRLVCASCSTKTSLINGISARTCDDCYQQLFGTNVNSKTTRTSEDEPYSQIGDNVSTSSMSPRNFSPAQGGVSTIMEETIPSLADAIHHTQSEWKLQIEEQQNLITREDFFYEQAPSTALCLSILELHSNDQTCGQLMLQLCDDLSQHLKPIAPGVPNPEVDYSLVLSMMKTLLFHAKLKFTKCGENRSMGQCDVYQSRIDLLGVLVTDNYRDLPSLQELTKPDLVKRLRDKLIKDERLPLAVEVSTKCGLDPSGVWSAWGMNCLQGGDFIAAREKFSRCLRAPVDKHSIHHSSKLLNDIIEYLEALPSVGTVEMILNKQFSMKTLLASPSASYKEEASMDTNQYQECLYYLKAYGTLYLMVDFYRRNGYWMKAVQFVIDQKCTAEVYVEGLLIPAIHSGETGKLFDQMVMTDPSLEKWNMYLTAACRYLLKNKLHHILYEFQIFMKDFIRAAMTCITCFYLRGAQSYLDLAGRLHYLHKAYQHMQSYLDPSQWGSVRRPRPNPSKNTPDWSKSGSSTGEMAVRLAQTENEVGKHLRMIALQIEVTKFLQQCLAHAEADATNVAMAYVGESKSSQLPTMFSSSKSRSDLVTMVLLSGNDIKAAFDLSNKIIKECNLGAVTIYTHAAREMAKHQRYINVRQLLDFVNKSGYNEDDTVDEIVGACILVIADNPSEAKEAENLIKLLRKDSNKINAYILCGKLRSAYLMAVKADRVEDVQRIAGAAQRMGQTAVKNICNKWLQQRSQ